MKPIIVIDTGTFDEAIKINKRELIPLFMDKDAICSSGHIRMAEIRTGGQLKDSAIYLNSDYNWHIGKDNDGMTVIIPITKN